MVYLPTTPLSPTTLGDDIPTDSKRGGPSEPVLDPPRLNRQSVVQSDHHDPVVGNQIALATNQILIQSLQLQSNSESSSRISHESVRSFHSIQDPKRI